MDDELLTFLDYEGVLGVLASTLDGLVIAAAGVDADDAEILGAAGSTLWSSIGASDSASGSIEVSGASLHVLLGEELSLVALAERTVPHEALAEVMQEQLNAVSGLFA